MKRLCAVFLTVFLLLIVSCQGVGGGSASGEDSPYKEKSFLSFLVKYEDGSFLFPKVPWGATKAECLKAMNLSEKDLSLLGGSDEEFKTYLVKKPFCFEDISCSAIVMVEFYKDQFRLIRVNITDDMSIWADEPYLEVSAEEAYTNGDMLQILSKVADQIEASSMPDSEINGGVDGGLRVGDIRHVAAKWWDAKGNISFEVYPVYGGSANEANVVSFTLRNNLGI